MELTEDVAKWLRKNAYAVKGEDYWFLSDFPSEQTPDKLAIPVSKRSWKKWKAGAMKQKVIQRGYMAEKEGKLSYEELVNILCVLALDVKDIRDQVNVMWNELIHHSGEMNLKGDWYGLDKRLRMVEEELDGVRIHYTDTLKGIKTNDKKKRIYKYQ